MASVDTIIASSLSSSSSSSSSSLPSTNIFYNVRKKFDVFLSFRGSDTRKNFTDHLFDAMVRKGIFTFRDHEELERGRCIAEELLMAIEESKFAVVVLSRNYASSTWCLAELAKIIDCMETKNLIVLPIFYYVNPRDVLDQTGDFAEAFAKHEKRFRDRTEVVSLWRDALTKVAKIRGWVLNYGDPESQLIQEFIESLSNQMPEDGSTNWNLPPRFDDSPDEADDDAGETVQDYAADLPREMIEKPEDSSPIWDLSPRHGYPDHAAHVVQEAHVIQNHVAHLSQVTTALRRDGLASINSIIGIDFSQTNEWKGQLSFHRLSLQATRYTPNPCEKVISILGEVLAPFSEDNMIPCFGFGDETTKDKNVFSFHNDDSPCHGYQEVLSCYKRILPNLQFAGRTSYAPVIDAATNIVEKSCGQYHILFIITDGQAMRSVDTSDDLSAQEVQTIKSIVEASSCPLSIVLVGVGDGPWEDMQKFMKKIPAHAFDNFKFVNFTEFMSEMETPSNNETTFAAAALIDIPTQYKKAIELGMLGCVTGKAKKISPLPPPVPAVKPSNSSSSLADMKTLMVCTICVTNTKGMAFFPCGHTTCVECGEKLEICPFCRKTFTGRLRLFLG